MAGAKVFDIAFLSSRLSDAVRWADDAAGRLAPMGLFGASTGAAAALVTAAELGSRIGAVVSRGGRPDLAGDALEKVVSPTLLIVGGADHGVIELNQYALGRLKGHAQPGNRAGRHAFFRGAGRDGTGDAIGGGLVRALSHTLPDMRRT